MTQSLSNFILSLFAGGFVLSAITVAVIFVSKSDPLKRSS
jgi:hypothetical protein